MINSKFLFLSPLLLLLFATEVFSQSSAKIVISRHKELLLRSKLVHDIDSIVKNYDVNKQQWNNIDYNDTQRAGWKLPGHLENVKVLSLEYVDRTSQNYHRPGLKKIIDGAMQHWIEHKYKSSNWWHNEIGIPLIMRDIITLLKDELTQDELNKYLVIMAQHDVKGTGANLTWSADIGTYYALFMNNYEKAGEYSKLLQNEIKISDAEGLKPDFSFHQHNERLQMYQYGASFLLTNIRLAWELRSTQWAYEAKKINLLTDMLLNGWQWMARGVNTVPGTMDRSISRMDATKAADIRTYIPLFIDLSPENNQALQSLYKSQSKNQGLLHGFKYYPYSDMTTYHRPGFSFFLKTISARTLTTEQINSENLKGKLLNSGDHYFVRTGNEYHNIMPVWDWNYLPGMSAFSTASLIGKKEFVGSVSDGELGLTAMDYIMKDSQNTKSFSAKKIWVNYQDMLICLIADIKLNNIETAYTTLDQSRLTSDVFINNRRIDSGQYEIKNKSFLSHNKLVYAPLFDDKLELEIGTAKGSWYSINHSYKNDVIEERVFKLWIRHDKSKVNNQSGYIISYAANRTSPNHFVNKKQFDILSNNASIQAISFGGNKVFCSFYTAGNIRTKTASLSVDKPCLLMINEAKISVSDPSRKADVVKVSYNKNVYKINLKSDGTTTTVKL